MSRAPMPRRMQTARNVSFWSHDLNGIQHQFRHRLRLFSVERIQTLNRSVPFLQILVLTCL